MKSLQDFNFSNKKVLLRCDFNIPLSKEGFVLEDFRIKKSLRTIKYLVRKKAKIIIISHLGNPMGRKVKNLTLDPVQKKLIELLGFFVQKSNDCIGENVKKLVSKMRPGNILLLENIRFEKGEEANDKKFAKELSKLGDIYINDAFGASHRNHASVSLLPRYLPSGAGFLLKEEIKALSLVLQNPKKPLVAIIGGMKISTKIKVIEKFLEIADYVILGGGIANSILISKDMMQSNMSSKKEILAEIKKIDLTNLKMHLPVDGIIKLKNNHLIRHGAIGTIKKEEMVYDIGPETIKIFKKIIKEGKMIIWNGPLGYSEDKRFEKGTKAIVLAIQKNKKAFRVAGGGETIEAINKFGFLDKFDHISTGGGAMLDFLAGKKLPGIIALDK